MTFGALLDALYTDVDGVVELRALPSTQRVFADPRDRGTLRAFLRAHRPTENLYYAVATRQDATNGTAANLLALPAFYSDLDFKDSPEAAARQRLAACPCPPSCVVHSGGGLHAYWFLREAHDVSTAAARDTVKMWLKRLATYLVADPSVADTARVLRVPGSYNRKPTYDPPRRVVIEVLDPDRRYNASEFEEWLPAVPRDPDPPPRTATGKVAAGGRHRYLMRLAGSMRRKGFSGTAIAAALITENGERCDPPLPLDEVQRMAHDAGHYRPEADAAAEDEDVTLTSLGTLLQEPDEAYDWLVTDRFACGSVNLIAGRPKAGKSTLARALALSVARGDRWLGHRCHPGRVVYLALEDKRSEVKRHLRTMGATGAEPIRFLIGSAPRDLLAKLTALVAAGDTIDLLIVDTLQRLVPVKDSNDYALVTAAFEPVLALARTHGTCIVLLHHAGKSDRGGLEAVLGSIGYTASADNVLLLNRTDKYRLISTIQRIGPDLSDTVVVMDEATGDVHLGGSRYLVDLQLVEVALVESVRATPAGITRADLLAEVEARRELKLKALKNLIDQGRILRTGAGHRHDPYRFVVAPEPHDAPTTPTRPPEPHAPPRPLDAKSCHVVPGFPHRDGNPMNTPPGVTSTGQNPDVSCGSRECAGSHVVPDGGGPAVMASDDPVPAWVTADDGPPPEPGSSHDHFASRDAEDVAAEEDSDVF